MAWFARWLFRRTHASHIHALELWADELASRGAILEASDPRRSACWLSKAQGCRDTLTTLGLR